MPKPSPLPRRKRPGKRTISGIRWKAGIGRCPKRAVIPAHDATPAVPDRVVVGPNVRPGPNTVGRTDPPARKLLPRTGHAPNGHEEKNRGETNSRRLRNGLVGTSLVVIAKRFDAIAPLGKSVHRSLRRPAVGTGLRRAIPLPDPLASPGIRNEERRIVPEMIAVGRSALSIHRRYSMRVAGSRTICLIGWAGRNVAQRSGSMNSTLIGIPAMTGATMMVLVQPSLTTRPGGRAPAIGDGVGVGKTNPRQRLQQHRDRSMTTMKPWMIVLPTTKASVRA